MCFVCVFCVGAHACVCVRVGACVKTLSCRRRDDVMSDVPSHDFKVDGARAARLINRA